MSATARFQGYDLSVITTTLLHSPHEKHTHLGVFCPSLSSLLFPSLFFPFLSYIVSLLVYLSYLNYIIIKYIYINYQQEMVLKSTVVK